MKPAPTAAKRKKRNTTMTGSPASEIQILSPGVPLNTNQRKTGKTLMEFLDFGQKEAYREAGYDNKKAHTPGDRVSSQPPPYRFGDDNYRYRTFTNLDPDQKERWKALTRAMKASTYLDPTIGL